MTLELRHCRCGVRRLAPTEQGLWSGQGGRLLCHRFATERGKTGARGVERGKASPCNSAKSLEIGGASGCDAELQGEGLSSRWIQTCSLSPRMKVQRLLKSGAQLYYTSSCLAVGGAQTSACRPCSPPTRRRTGRQRLRSRPPWPLRMERHRVSPLRGDAQ